MDGDKTFIRNYAIYKQYMNGRKSSYLSKKYNLSPPRIANIVRKFSDMERFYSYLGGMNGITDDLKKQLISMCSTHNTTNKLFRFVRSIKQYEIRYFGKEKKNENLTKEFVLEMDDLMFLDIPGVGKTMYDLLIQLKKDLKKGDVA